MAKEHSVSLKERFYTAKLKFPPVLGVYDQVLKAKWGGNRDGFSEKLVDTSSTSNMPMPAAIDLLLSKAKPNCDDRKASRIAHLRRKKNYCAGAIAAREQ